MVVYNLLSKIIIILPTNKEMPNHIPCLLKLFPAIASAPRYSVLYIAKIPMQVIAQYNNIKVQSSLSNKVFPAVVYVATSMSGDGHVKHFGRGELIIGNIGQSELATPELQKIADLFLDANICPIVPVPQNKSITTSSLFRFSSNT